MDHLSLGSVPSIAANCARVISFAPIRNAETVLVLVAVASSWKVPARTYFRVPMVSEMRSVISSATATVLLAGVTVNPAGFAKATVTLRSLATVMAEMPRVRVSPVPFKLPLVAPVTVMSPIAKVVGSTLKLRVSAVVVTVPDVPSAVRPVKVTTGKVVHFANKVKAVSAVYVAPSAYEMPPPSATVFQPAKL